MVFVGTDSTYNKHDYDDYWCGEPRYRENIMFDAKREAEDQVKTDYPYSVYRDRQEITQKAEQIFQQWQQSIEPPSHQRERRYSSGERVIDRWNKEQGERKRLYVSTFVGKYLEELAKKDEAARPKVQPQPAATPATPSNTAILKGATLTLKDVVHNADECIYYVEIEDPGYLDGVLPAEIYSPLEEAPPAQASSGYGIASSSYGFASSGSSVSPSYQSPKKKGTRLYVRNVGKK